MSLREKGKCEAYEKTAIMLFRPLQGIHAIVKVCWSVIEGHKDVR